MIIFEIMTKLDQFLREVNPYYKSYKQMHEFEIKQQREAIKSCLLRTFKCTLK
jgi:hypothetical protein